MSITMRFLPAVLTLACLLVLALAASAGSAAVTADPADPNGDAGAGEAPRRGLVPDQIYAVLAGEFAGRRGRLDVAFTHYLEAARLTGSPRMAELAVRAALSADDLPSAETALALWRELAPDASEVHQVAAFVRIKAEDWDGVLAHLVSLVEAAEAEAAFNQAGAIISRIADAERRVALMEALIARFPDDADANQALAMVAASAAHFEVAQRAARRASELRPDWSAPRLFLVRLLVSQEKREEARALLEEFVGANPEDDALRMIYAQFLVDEEDFSGARAVFEQVLAKQPAEPDVLFALGVLALQLEDFAGARGYFERLAATGERDADAAFYLGQTAEGLEQPAQAITWYEQVGGDKATDARVRIALLKAKAGQVTEAREILQQLRAESPDDAIALFLVEAEILDEVGKKAEVMDVYRAGLEAFPNDLDLLYARGLFAVKLDQLAQAERDFRDIIAADPQHADALNALGYTLADRTARYQEAMELIERAYAIKPEEPAILDSMGWVAFKLGDYERALTLLQQALAIMSDGEIAAHLGEVLWVMGRRQEALEVWQAALGEHPDHAYLQAVVARYRIDQSELEVPEKPAAAAPGGDR